MVDVDIENHVEGYVEGYVRTPETFQQTIAAKTKHEHDFLDQYLSAFPDKWLSTLTGPSTVHQKTSAP